MHDRTQYRLTWLTAAMSLGHHLDHLIRGNAVGWPVTDQAHGKPIVMALLYWAGEIDAGERAVARFRGLATPFADMVRPMPHPELYQFTEGGPGPDHEAVRSLFLDTVELPTEEAIEVSQAGMGTAAAPEASRNVFRLEGEYWTVVFDGSVLRLRDTKGLRHLARLLAHPGREFHATDLEAADRQAAPAGSQDRAAGEGLVVRPNLGDAGKLLDTTAKAAYRARLAELRGELEEAEGCNDPARAARARQEMEFLVGELARAVGLGGRDRRAASHAERARLNATRAIRAAMANLARADPALGRHLTATVRTGRYCSYTPDPRVPIAWER
jgi:hypothetical protein